MSEKNAKAIEKNAYAKQKLDRKCRKKQLVTRNCFEGVARQNQRDKPNSGFLVLLLLLKRGSQLEKKTLMY